MLSDDLKRLEASFKGWMDGTSPVTGDAMHQFGRDLRLVVGKALLLEMGIDPQTLVALAVAGSTLGSNVTLLSDHRVRRALAGKPGASV